MTFDEALQVTEEDKTAIREGLLEMGVDETIITDDFIESYGVISKIFALSDESFDAVQGLLREQIYKQYNDPATKKALVQFIQKPDFNREKIIGEFSEIFMAMKDGAEQIGVKLSQSKLDFIDYCIAVYANAIDKAIYHRDLITIPIELTSENGRIPQFGTLGAAGADLYSTVEMDLKPGEQAIIPLDFKVEIPDGYAMLIHPRSGQSAKTKLRICNTPGLIDSRKETNQWVA